MKLKLKAKRVEKGYTQADMARLLEISVATYNRYECGHTEMLESTINKVLNILECKYEDIFLY